MVSYPASRLRSSQNGEKLRVGDDCIEVAARYARCVSHFCKRQVPGVNVAEILILARHHRDGPGADRVELQTSVAERAAKSVQRYVAWSDGHQRGVAANGTGVGGETQSRILPTCPPSCFDHSCATIQEMVS